MVELSLESKYFLLLSKTQRHRFFLFTEFKDDCSWMVEGMMVV